MNISEVKVIYNAIKRGWKKSIDFHMKATEKYYEPIKPEYLTTVNIAQSLVEKNVDFGYPFIVEIEKETSDVFCNCFKVVKIEKTEHKYKNKYTKRRRHNSTTRSGKLDIAIYKKSNDIYKEYDTKYVIEVKNFNQQNSLIIKDITRLKELALLKDDVGESSFEIGFVTFANYYKDVFNYQDCLAKHSENMKWLNKIDKSSINLLPKYFKISLYTPTDEPLAKEYAASRIYL